MKSLFHILLILQKNKTCEIYQIDPKDVKKSGSLLGVAKVSKSCDDVDNKFKARNWALTFALENAKFDRKTRREIWKQYFKSINFNVVQN